MLFHYKNLHFSMFCIGKLVKPMENTYFYIFPIIFSFIILGLKIPKIQKSKHPRVSERYQTEFCIFGFLDFWIFGFLDFWISGFLDFWILASTK